MTLSLQRRHAIGLAAGMLALPRLGRAAETVRVGYQKNGSLVVVRQRKMLEAAGLVPDYVEFPSGPPLLEALNAGAIDFGATGDTPPIFAQAAGSGLLYVGAQPVSGTNQAVLVRDGGPVKTLADLRGRRLAFTKGSSAHNMVVKVLASAGLKPSDVQQVFLQPADAAAAFRAGSLDAWGIWDPFFAIAQADPATRVLTTAEGVAPSNSFFLASRRIAESRPQTVLKLLEVINQAAAWARSEPEELARVLSQVTGVPLDVQRVSAARGVYAVQPVDDGVIARQQEIADTFASLRIIPQRIDIREAVWRQPWTVTEVSR